MSFNDKMNDMNLQVWQRRRFKCDGLGCVSETYCEVFLSCQNMQYRRSVKNLTGIRSG